MATADRALTVLLAVLAQGMTVAWAQEIAPVPIITSDGELTCAMLEGRAHCWGWLIRRPNRADGSYDDGTHPLTLLRGPALVPGDPGITSVRVGQLHACGLIAAGELWCIGRTGQPGAAPFTAEVRTSTCGRVPCVHRMVRVAAPLTFRVFGLSEQTACGITRQSRLYCWGLNEHGQAGGAGGAMVTRPRAVLPALRFARVSVMDYNTCALTEAGELWCWGQDYPTPGDDSPRRTPQRIPAEVRFAEIEGQAALTVDGAAWEWDLVYHGRLVDGVVGSCPSGRASCMGPPRPRAEGIRFRQLVPGYPLGCGITVEGRFHCVRGGDRVAEAAPAEGLIAVAFGGNNACGMTDRHEVVCWGSWRTDRFGNRATLPPTVVPRATWPAELGDPSAATPAPGDTAGASPKRGRVPATGPPTSVRP